MSRRITHMIVLIVVALQLSGCASWYQAYEDPNGRRDWPTQLNLSRPDLVAGQKAYVYAGGGLISALRETNLFSSVEYTSSKQPTPNGIYISLTERDHYASRDSGFFGFFVWFMTLGLIPDPQCHSTTYVYDLKVYQNGGLLIQMSPHIKWDQMCGWAALAQDESQTNRNESHLLVNLMITELNKKK